MDSLEKVITFYVDLAERRCNEARKQADAAALAAASAKITDLENDVVRAVPCRGCLPGLAGSAG